MNPVNDERRQYVTTWWRMLRVHRRLSEARETELKQCGLTLHQVAGLEAVRQLGRAATISEIARRLDRNTNTSLAMLRRLERQGFVTCWSDLRQKNRKRYELTKLGNKYFQKATKNESITEILTVLSEEEIAEFYASLGKISEAAAEYLDLPERKPARQVRKK